MPSSSLPLLRKNIAFFVTALLILAATAFVLFQLSRSRTFQFFGGLTHRIETSEKLVALTFDDGPTEKTEELLATLASSSTKATFFVIGKDAAEHPEELQKLVEAGHELGNHTYSHQRMVLKSWSFIATELEETTRLIREAGYEHPIHFRPPYGKKLFLLPLYLRQTNTRTITWDVEPESVLSSDATAEEITTHVLRTTRPGSIILLHPWYGSQPSRDSIAPIIEGLRTQGYEFVTISELLEKQQ